MAGAYTSNVADSAFGGLANAGSNLISNFDKSGGHLTAPAGGDVWERWRCKFRPAKVEWAKQLFKNALREYGEDPTNSPVRPAYDNWADELLGLDDVSGSRGAGGSSIDDEVDTYLADPQVGLGVWAIYCAKRKDRQLQVSVQLSLTRKFMDNLNFDFTQLAEGTTCCNFKSAVLSFMQLQLDATFVGYSLVQVGMHFLSLNPTDVPAENSTVK
ncbi:hypothetical protein C8R43DRAFT_947327 [Mycena crocata]|nr:hypothetical protein C8R43DRAFT_947327 [Mycena crocata]